MVSELLEASFEATRSGGGGASRSRCGRTSPAPRANGEATAGRFRDDGARDGFICGRTGVEISGALSAASLPRRLLETLLELDGCSDDAEFDEGCESLDSATEAATDDCEALDAFL